MKIRVILITLACCIALANSSSAQLQVKQHGPFYLNGALDICYGKNGRTFLGADAGFYFRDSDRWNKVEASFNSTTFHPRFTKDID